MDSDKTRLFAKVKMKPTVGENQIATTYVEGLLAGLIEGDYDMK
jgi:hypothetical protein